MTAEIGLFALILALMAALHQAIFPMLGALRGDIGLMRGARFSALAQLALVGLAFASLVVAFAVSDFSVRNVAENSNTAKPYFYKLAGAWGSHEGSLLLWVLILAGFGGAAALQKGAMTPLRARALAVQGLIAVAFLAFIIFASNPFARIFPPPADGADMNPLLQDPGLIVHPPFLYLGYVGFSVAFSYAVAGLIDGKVDQAFAREMRPWALSAWMFLTIGISLGAWWAYYELGWGGFWSWDPVENASFMPWLAGTALIHSLRVTATRGAFRAWTVLLSILAFSLSLIGTFLVRSGILTSVHAFAVDSLRGEVILAILAVAIGGALTLYAIRGPSLTTRASFDTVSRESALLFNNILLVAACSVVFFGTFYPLFVELSGGKISVLAPYFNIVFPPFVVLMLVLMPIGAALAWRRGALGPTLRGLIPACLAALAATGLALFIAKPGLAISAGVAGLGAFAIVGTIGDLLRRIDVRTRGAGERLFNLPPSLKGMALAHIGLGVVAIGAVGAGAWKSEAVGYVDKGGAIAVGGFHATLAAVTEGQGPNYAYQRGEFHVTGDGPARKIFAERRFYPVRGVQTTEAGYATGLLGDIYLSIGEHAPDKGWVVRAWRHPLVGWLWFGAGLTALGGLVALVSGRKRQAPSPEAAAAVLTKVAA